MYPIGLKEHPELAEQPEIMCRGGSAIISPLGEVIASTVGHKFVVSYYT